MIKANELRIGNTILSPDTGKWVSVEVNHIRAIIDGVKFNGKSYEAIRLTDEILDQCGFENGYLQVADQTIFCDAEQSVILLQGSDSATAGQSFPCCIDYLHELQNLYFSLTGSELTVNHTTLSLLH